MKKAAFLPLALVAFLSFTPAQAEAGQMWYSAGYDDKLIYVDSKGGKTYLRVCQWKTTTGRSYATLNLQQYSESHKGPHTTKPKELKKCPLQGGPWSEDYFLKQRVYDYLVFG